MKKYKHKVQSSKKKLIISHGGERIVPGGKKIYNKLKKKERKIVQKKGDSFSNKLIILDRLVNSSARIVYAILITIILITLIIRAR